MRLKAAFCETPRVGIWPDRIEERLINAFGCAAMVACRLMSNIRA